MDVFGSVRMKALNKTEGNKWMVEKVVNGWFLYHIEYNKDEGSKWMVSLSYRIY